MYVRDVMTTNVVTIPSSTSITDARRIMLAHRFRRLPVVDKGKLVGLITGEGLEKVSPSKATSLTVWELSYLLDKTPVRDVMEKNVITVTPDMTVEEALALAQGNRVGCLVVMDNNRVEGILTTNDFFYKIVNPVLGLGQPGFRLEIADGGNSKKVEDIIATVNRMGLKLTTIHIVPDGEGQPKDAVIHVNVPDASALVAELQKKGYQVKIRAR